MYQPKVISAAEAKAQGISSAMIWAACQWNYSRAGEVKNQADEHRHMLTANALEKVARKLEKDGA